MKDVQRPSGRLPLCKSKSLGVPQEQDRHVFFFFFFEFYFYPGAHQRDHRAASLHTLEGRPAGYLAHSYFSTQSPIHRAGGV